MPSELDPAKVTAAPEADIVRAIYDGLTDIDSKTLKAIPGIAERWHSSEDQRTWTFVLRQNARWSNGERVTAQDFVRSWKRLRDLGEKAPHGYLAGNIVGMRQPESGSSSTEDEELVDPDVLEGQPGEPEPGSTAAAPAAMRPQSRPSPGAPAASGTVRGRRAPSNVDSFGVQAVDQHTLRVELELPDKDLPKLVANPVFRPLYGNAPKTANGRPAAGTVTNGAFAIAEVTASEIVLDRSETYWNRRAIALERVRFVGTDVPEEALNAYRRGDIDVLTNAEFEAAALKVLRPYEDFRRVAHNALAFYEFNSAVPPFVDRRVREALAAAIDREKLSDGDMEGTTEPAYRFFPSTGLSEDLLTYDLERARRLLEQAGYPGAEGIGPIRLVIRRNNVQQRVARSVARMWKQGLNIDTEIIVKEPAELAEARQTGDFDLIRRGVVLPGNNELMDLAAIVGDAEKLVRAPVPVASPPRPGTPSDTPDPGASPSPAETRPPVLTEDDLLYDMTAIPLYFPVSYALVKPYVRGFEANALDAPSLKEMSLDLEWRPRS